MMFKTVDDVLNGWVIRGYVTEEDIVKNKDKYTSFINQAKDSILAYCNIPLNAGMPNGLFYPWVEISYGTSKGTITVEGSGAIKSIQEGDTKIDFDVSSSVVKADKLTIDYTTTLNRFRRLPQ